MAKLRELRTYKVRSEPLTRIKQRVKFGRSQSGCYGLFTNGFMAMPLPDDAHTWSLAKLRAEAARHDFDFVEV